jgi:hypothetical protein
VEKYPTGYKKRKEKRMTKLEDKKIKAVKEINEIKALQARQDEVINLFKLSDAKEEEVTKLVQGIKKTETYAQACESFRLSALSALSAIEDKVFKTAQELADLLEIDKNKMSRIKKAGQVFRLYSSEDLSALGYDELTIKALTHDEPKLVTELIEGEKSIEEVKEEKAQKNADNSKKLGKAVDKVIELLGDSSIAEMDRWNAFKQIRAQVINTMPKKIAEQEKQLLDQWQAMQAGKKSKVNA